MSFFKKGKKNTANKPKEATSQQSSEEKRKAIEDIYEQQNKRAQLLEQQIQIYKKQALNALKAGKKQEALTNMKKMKTYEKNLTYTRSQAEKIDYFQDQIQKAMVDKDVVKAHELVNDVLKSLKKEMDADKIEDLVSENEDLIEDIHEIEEIISRPVAGMMSDEEAMAELNKLAEEDADNMLTSMETPQHAPAATTTETTTEKETTNELNELEGMLES